VVWFHHIFTWYQSLNNPAMSSSSSTSSLDPSPRSLLGTTLFYGNHKSFWPCVAPSSVGTLIVLSLSQRRLMPLIVRGLFQITGYRFHQCISLMGGAWSCYYVHHYSCSLEDHQHVCISVCTHNSVVHTPCHHAQGRPIHCCILQQDEGFTGKMVEPLEDEDSISPMF
jgi:hypothetical protein